MTSWPILTVITFLPLVGALFIAFLNEDEAGVRNARWVALWTTLITFIISLILVWRFDPASADFQFLEKRPWLGGKPGPSKVGSVRSRNLSISII